MDGVVQVGITYCTSYVLRKSHYLLFFCGHEENHHITPAAQGGRQCQTSTD